MSVCESTHVRMIDICTCRWYVYPIMPGTAAPITVTVNGAPATQQCNDSTVTINNPLALTTAETSGNLAVPGPQCAFVYSSFLTPKLTALPLRNLADSVTTPTTFSFQGQLPSSTSYTIMVGSKPCVVTSVTPTAGTQNTLTVNCTLPLLPAGNYLLQVLADGYGAAMPIPMTVNGGPMPTIVNPPVIS